MTWRGLKCYSWKLRTQICFFTASTNCLSLVDRVVFLAWVKKLVSLWLFQHLLKVFLPADIAKCWAQENSRFFQRKAYHANLCTWVLVFYLCANQKQLWLNFSVSSLIKWCCFESVYRCVFSCYPAVYFAPWVLPGLHLLKSLTPFLCHSFQVSMPNSPLLLKYLYFGTRFL